LLANLFLDRAGAGHLLTDRPDLPHLTAADLGRGFAGHADLLARGVGRFAGARVEAARAAGFLPAVILLTGLAVLLHHPLAAALADGLAGGLLTAHGAVAVL